jgi:hypothetical protein
MLLEWAVDQPPTGILSSLTPNIVEATLLPSQVTNVEIPNEEFEVGAINLLDPFQVCTYQFGLDSSVSCFKKHFLTSMFNLFLFNNLTSPCGCLLG